MKLLNKEKQGLYQAIMDGGLNPKLFQLWGADSRDEPIIIRYPDSDYLFTIQIPDPVTFHIQYQPAGDVYSAKLNVRAGIQYTYPYIAKWVKSIISELQTPDPWTTLEDSTFPDMAPGINGRNSPFTVTEWKTTSKGLEDIRTLLLKSASNSEEAQKEIQTQISQLIQNGEKMGRKDWFNLTVGTLVSLALTIGLPPENTKAMWEILKGSVTGIIELAPLVSHVVAELGN